MANYEEWSGRGSIFKDKLIDLRNKQITPVAASLMETTSTAHYLNNLNIPVAVPIHNKAAAVEPSYNQSIYDEITGFYTYHYLVKTLEYELKRGTRYKRPLALAFIAVNGARDILNREKTASAIQCLEKSLADIIQSCIRDVDIPAHRTDFNFAVLFPETTTSGLTSVLERIRQQVRQAPVLFATQQYQFFASIGAATFPTHARNADDLVACVTQALDVALKRGGDRVCIV